MRRYRFYMFDIAGRLVEEEREFRAKDDQIAVEVVEGWRRGRRAELWFRHRQVKIWKFRPMV